MKFLLSFIVFISTSNSYAWECGEFDRYTQPIEKHLELASEVFIGKVMSGEVKNEEKNDYDVVLTFMPSLTIKGNANRAMTLYTSSQPPYSRFELPGTYAIFLYSSNEVSFCNLVLPFAGSISSKRELENYINRKDIEGAGHYKPLLDYAKSLQINTR